MKNSVLMTISALMALSASTSFAAPMRVNEVRTRFERDVREGQKQFQNGARLDQVRQDATRDLSALTGGRVSTREMGAALNKVLKLKEGEVEVEVNLLHLAQALRDAQTVTKSLNRNELDAEAKKLVEQKDRALEIVPKFLALASNISRADSPAKQKEIDVFTKQISLVNEMVSKMDTAELKSHLDVMELAVENRLRNPELEGDQAYSQALKAKFGDKYAQKVEEILGCLRQ